MVLVAEQKFTIERPVDEVFSYISDMENFGQWFPGVISIRSSNDLPSGAVGKHYVESVKVPLRGHKDVTIKVVESVANQKFVTEGKLPPLMPRMEVTFQKTGDRRCDVEWRMFSRNNSHLFRLVGLPMVRSIMGSRARQGAATIKEILR